MLEILPGTLTDDNVDVTNATTQGLARFFDCEDQRELEYCHPNLVGENIGYLPNTTATWLDPANLEDIEYVIINQPGDAPRIMNFEENFGQILAMAGFVPSAEFYEPDPNPDLDGTPFEDVLIRQQVLGTYGMTDVAALAPQITSTAVTTAAIGEEYTYDVTATAFPGPITYSLDTSPTGMTIDDTSGLITWTPGASGDHDVAVRASNGTDPDAVQEFTVAVPTTLLDDFSRPNGKLGGNWGGLTGGYAIANQQVDANLIGGPIYWKQSFGASQEAAMTLTKLDSRGLQGLFLKGNADHLRLSAIAVMYDPSRRRVLVEAKEYGKLPKTVGTFPATLKAGDRLGAQALANGTVRVTVNGALVGTASAGTFFVNRGGHVGALYLLAGNGMFDDFGGGSLSP